MKKLLGIVVLSLLFIVNANAKEQVWYCVDDLVTGMDGEYKSTQEYKAGRFNLKLNTNDLSEIIIDGDKFKKIGNKVLMIYVDDIGSMLRFHSYDGDKYGYHRSNLWNV